VIVLDEHLHEVGVEEAIRRWYHGRVCTITSLRPNTVVKDESVPGLLRTVSQPTFVTLNWRHFWQQTPARGGLCLICFTLPTARAAEVSPLLRRLLRLQEFKTKAARMGKIARISAEQVAYYRVHDQQLRTLPLP
jgi:hypothetical protein